MLLAEADMIQDSSKAALPLCKVQIFSRIIFLKIISNGHQNIHRQVKCGAKSHPVQWSRLQNYN